MLATQCSALHHRCRRTSFCEGIRHRIHVGRGETPQQTRCAEAGSAEHKLHPWPVALECLGAIHLERGHQFGQCQVASRTCSIRQRGLTPQSLSFAGEGSDCRRQAFFGDYHTHLAEHPAGCKLCRCRSDVLLQTCLLRVG